VHPRRGYDENINPRNMGNMNELLGVGSVDRLGHPSEKMEDH
jgi:hypothetical protein